jgi:hypothetical protein
LLSLLPLRDCHQRSHQDHRADESISHLSTPIVRRCFRFTE